MTHSINARRQSVIEARNYEVALSDLIMDEKEYLSNLAANAEADPWFEAKFAPRFSLLKTLETYRRALLTSTESGFPEDEIRDLESLVRERMARDRRMPESDDGA